ncbi:hypothetical protein PHLCEN_2v5533 [Hermanssonia centrifuga]|uniref:Uncharacterized protein n=1 Tax=Hermanssonia centrifuga TaxID=98765 RepID=A0A2R6P291_9APHY|nr:hypothetical protein PHLCEN_2v5533 [Hermanssonia centrifuga]
MSVFDKLHELKDSLDHHSSQPVPAGDAKGQEEVRAEMHGEERREEEIQSKEGWSHKIKDVLDGGNARKKREEEEELLRIENEKEEARKKIEATRGWTGKIHDILDGGKHKEELELEEFQRLEDQAQAEQKKGDHLSQKVLGDILF